MAINPDNLKLIAKILAGAGLGAGFGYGVMPHISGYAQDENARRLSGTINAATGAIIGGLMHNPAAALAQYKGLGLKGQIGLPAGYLATEMIPVGVAALHSGSEASRAQAEAARTSSIPSAIAQALTSNTGKGVGVGAGLGALGGVLSGLNRLPSSNEIADNTSRSKMVGKDLLKYLLPAMVAGGVAGSFVPEKPAV